MKVAGPPCAGLGLMSTADAGPAASVSPAVPRLSAAPAGTGGTVSPAAAGCAAAACAQLHVPVPASNSAVEVPALGVSPVQSMGNQVAVPASVEVAEGLPAGNQAGGLTPVGPALDDIVAFGGIPDPGAEGRRLSRRLQDLPDADDLQMGRAMRATKLRDIEDTTGCLPGHYVNPYVVATHSDGCQGAYGYWVCPMGDGSAGYLQPVWMAVM